MNDAKISADLTNVTVQRYRLPNCNLRIITLHIILPEDQQKYISNWLASGLSQASYCRAHGLNAKTSGNWLHAHKRGCIDIKSLALIPVTIKPTAASSAVLQLRCRCAQNALQYRQEQVRMGTNSIRSGIRE